ncbi:hypothetical protein SADUNF_Sadunf08G0056500 [Salix dunnii]|uniref:Uncharacterized protein n=1 Tax=Salix dunnii TaxID=1413687 RepID=A0A835K126_9ROSI|nr:hypothetical protein SADUNF_Sadunf08G0056500 [Salix dunnii]
MTQTQPRRRTARDHHENTTMKPSGCIYRIGRTIAGRKLKIALQTNHPSQLGQKLYRVGNLTE